MKWRHLAGYLRFTREFLAFRRESKAQAERFQLRWSDRLPCLDESTNTTGFDRHYVYHPAWAARILARQKPAEHLDISSSLHFISLVSAFISVRFFDYRPAPLQLGNLSCERADLQALPFADRSVRSVSCMHVVEHVGLGRYGDPLDPDGDLKAMRELQRVVAPGGSLLFVVPVGRPVIRFNAHRIYAATRIKEQFNELELKEFALIPDDPATGDLLVNAPLTLADSQNYGCGCFWFTRPV